MTTPQLVLDTFGSLPLPVTMEAFQKSLHLTPEYIAHTLKMYVEDGAVIKDENSGYWMSDAVMAEGIASAEKEIERLQAYQRHLEYQRRVLAARASSP